MEYSRVVADSPQVSMFSVIIWLFSIQHRGYSSLQTCYQLGSPEKEDLSLYRKLMWIIFSFSAHNPVTHSWILALQLRSEHFSVLSCEFVFDCQVLVPPYFFSAIPIKYPFLPGTASSYSSVVNFNFLHTCRSDFAYLLRIG